MWGKQVVIISAFALGGMLTGALNAISAPPVFYGIFVSYKGDTLTVMNKQGGKEQYRVTKETEVMSREGTNRLERLRFGSRLSISALDDKARVVTIQEVPK